MTWLGDWDGGAKRTVRLSACRLDEIFALWDNPFETQSDEREDTDTPKITAYELLDSVVKNLRLGKGEVRLLGYCDDPVGDNHFIPASTQTRGQTVVLAHLNPATLPPARPDANSILDFLSKRTLVDDGSIIDAELFNAQEPQ
jgi:hypothetical protein